MANSNVEKITEVSMSLSSLKHNTD